MLLFLLSLAQPFAVRVMLLDGHGLFSALDISIWWLIRSKPPNRSGLGCPWSLSFLSLDCCLQCCVFYFLCFMCFAHLVGLFGWPSLWARSFGHLYVGCFWTSSALVLSLSLLEGKWWTGLHYSWYIVHFFWNSTHLIFPEKKKKKRS